MIRALVWDMDGTLLNTLVDIMGACNEALAAHGLPTQPYETLIGLIGYGAEHLCHGASGLEGDALQEFMVDYRRRTMTRDDPQTTVYPGIEKVLKSAHECGLKLGIYTNKPEGWCTKLAMKFFGDGVFDAICGTTEEKILKPNPEGIFRMCKRWGISPAEVVMIGDSPVDYETSVRAGCQHIGVSWGFRSRVVLEKAGAKVIVDDAEALMAAWRAMM